MRRRPSLTRHRILASAVVLVCLLIAGSSVSPVSQAAVSSGGWTWKSSAITGGGGALSLQCPSTSLCLFVARNRIWWTTSPAAHSPSWHSVTLTDPYAASKGNATVFTGLSCPSTSFCMAIDTSGEIANSRTPTAAASTWNWQQLDAQREVAVSCGAPSLCGVLDNYGNVLTGSDPNDTGGPKWWVERFADVKYAPAYSITCVATNHCVAVEGSNKVGYAGNAGSFEPHWHVFTVPASRWNAASCPVASRCLVVGRSSTGAARLAIANTAASTASTWHSVDLPKAHAALRAIDCSSRYFCMAVTSTTAWFSGAPSAKASAWHLTSPPVGKAHIQYIQCPSSKRCYLLTGTHLLLAGSRP